MKNVGQKFILIMMYLCIRLAKRIGYYGVALPQNSGWRWPHNPTFRCCNNGGITEPQAGLAGLQGNAAESATAQQAPSSKIAQAATGCANPEEHHLGAEFYARHALLRQAL